MIDKLHFFTHTGSTYTFRDVIDFLENESVITFTFKSQKDGTIKTGTFYVKNIVGFTREDPDER